MIEESSNPLTPELAQAVFRSLAALRAQIAFGWLVEGCECRAQLMIEHLQQQWFQPGRAWMISVGRDLSIPNPRNPRQNIKWRNHVAPTLSVAGMEGALLIMDPSLSQGPLTLAAWASVMRVRTFETSLRGLSQRDILNRQATLALQGQDLDAMAFVLPLGEAPIPELGGSGFCLAPDPPEGVSIHAREMMKRYLALEQRLPKKQP